MLRRSSPLTLALALGFGAAAGTALAQDTSTYVGAANCRVAPVLPPPVDGVRWRGACKDGFAEGKGILTWHGADRIERTMEATLAAGQVQGEATIRLPDGALYIGTVRNGVPDGKGYFKDPDSLQYEGDVHGGRREGVAEALFPNGDRYKGEWQNGVPDGTGTMTYMLGGSYEGRWHRGLPNGRGTMTFAGSGRRAEVGFMNGVRIDAARPPLATGTAAGEKPEYAVNDANPRTGSHLADTIIRWSVPANVGYDRLTPAQQQIVRDRYPALDEGDEPPYPLKGPQQFLTDLLKVTERYSVVGPITIDVLVGADGKVVSVSTMGISDPDARRMAGIGAGLVQYKPARCGGQPCQMMMPISLDVTKR
jgi:hypothetical protein